MGRHVVVCQRSDNCSWSMVVERSDLGRALLLRDKHEDSHDHQVIPVKTLTTCQMCALNVFPGHGHRLYDGTILLEAKIRWL